MTADALASFLAALGERAGTPMLDDDEARDVLDVARVTAHRHERRFAPLACYALGVAAGAAGEQHDPAARRTRLAQALAAVQDLEPRRDDDG